MNTVISKRAVGIIPARGGSKGVPRKNMRQLGGMPLIQYTIEAARASRLSDFVISTDDAEITAIAQMQGCTVIQRPAELATDSTAMIPVVIHAVQTLVNAGQQFDYVMLLQPTAPLRTSEDIDASLTLLIESGADTVVSVTPVPGHCHPDWQFVIEDDHLHLYNREPWENLIPRRQLLSPTYTRNGAIYACKTSVLLENGSLYGSNVRAYVMPESRSVNIDSEFDLALAELRLSTHPPSNAEGTH